MALLSSIVNAAAVFVFATLGTLLSGKLPQKIADAMQKGISLCIIYIGIDGVLAGENALIAIISIALGALIGEWIDIDRHLNSLTSRLEAKAAGGRIAEGFVSATLMTCVGAWAITGAMDAGLRGDHSSLFAKTAVDSVSTFVLATTLGFGVALSSLSLLVYQGAFALLAVAIEPFLTQTIINELSCVGSLLIIAIGLNMAGITKIKVVNLLPSVIIPVILCSFM